MSSFTLIALTACAVAQFDPNFDPEGQHVQQHVREFEQIQQIYRQELMRDAAWVVDKSGGASIDRLYIAANGIAKSEMRKPRREIRGLAEDYAAHGLYGELGREINNAKAMVPRRHEVMRSELWKRTVEKSLSPAQRQTLYQARADRLVTRFLSELSTVNLTDAQTKTIRQHALGNFRDLVLAIAKDPSMIRFLNNQHLIIIQSIINAIIDFMEHTKIKNDRPNTDYNKNRNS